MYHIETIEVSAFAQNCRVLSLPGEPHAIVIDPGGDAERIFAYLNDNGLSVTEIWLTHAHLDHAGAVADLLEMFPDAKLLAHEGEKEMRASISQVAALYGLPPGMFRDCPEPHTYLVEGDEVALGSETLQVLFTPGHSPGHLSFYDSKNKILFAGDTLFQGSIGRYDLPMSNGDDLMRSLKEKIMALPDEVRVLPGHGPETTIGMERQYNPYVAGA